MSYRIVQGDVRARLAELPAASAHCVVTSPPYLGVRSYGTAPQIWGGSPDCDHRLIDGPSAPLQTGGHGAASPKQVSNAGTQWGNAWATERGPRATGVATASPKQNSNSGAVGIERGGVSATCTRCGAWRGELGSEPNPSLYVAHLVEVFRAVKRVLRADGTVWCNIGDSYAGVSGTSTTPGLSHGRERGYIRYDSNWHQTRNGVKAKDLQLIPERLAIALQDDGWYIRSRIAWCKTSAMPESVQDRPTNAWEHIFLLSKRPKYFYDADAIRTTGSEWAGNAGTFARADSTRGAALVPGNTATHRPDRDDRVPAGANLRNWWPLPPESFADAHFATFPSEIPRRAILAGTSAYGCCAACGAPWRRVTETSYRKHRPSGGKLSRVERGNKVHDGGFGGWGSFGTNLRKDVETTGWAPTCDHADAPVVPATVLDPFSGSGTTCLVAHQLGRHGLGIELNPEYVAMSERRLAADAPLVDAIAAVDAATQARLFEAEGA